MRLFKPPLFILDPDEDAMAEPSRKLRFEAWHLVLLAGVGVIIWWFMTQSPTAKAANAPTVTPTPTMAPPTATDFPTATPSQTASLTPAATFTGTIDPTYPASFYATAGPAPTIIMQTVMVQVTRVVQVQVQVPGELRVITVPVPYVITQIVYAATHTPLPTHTLQPTYTSEPTQTAWIITVEVTPTHTPSPTPTETPTVTPTEIPSPSPTFTETSEPTVTATVTETVCSQEGGD